MGIAATGALVSLVTRITLGPRLQVAIAVLYFFIFWALTVAGTLTILLPFGTCQFAISITYMEYTVIHSLGTSFTNVAILLAVSASMLSSCLGAWDTITDQTGETKDWRECDDRNWLAPVVLLALEAAEACKEGMEPSSKPKTVWFRLFWLWPRFIHNYIKGFRRLGSWSSSFGLKRYQTEPQVVESTGVVGERTPLLSQPAVQIVGGTAVH